MRKLPVVYEIQTTNRCNGQCIICPSRDMKNEKMDMPFRLFKKIIDNIHLAQESTVRIVMYLNGEPFLDPDFVNKLRYVRSTCEDVVVEISSNISYLSEDILAALCECKVDDFRISCFGFSEETYRHAMPGLRFSIFLENLEKLIQAKNTGAFSGEISLTMIDYPELLQSDYDNAKKFCEDHQMVFNFWGFLDRTGNVKRFSNHIVISEESERNKEYTCAQHRHLERMHILADGRVSLCCQDWEEKYILGSLASQSLEEIWNCDDYELLRRQIDEVGIPYPNICKKCKILLEGKKE